MQSSNEDLSIRQIRGVGPQRARLLADLGITTITDALYYLPFRYEDRSHLTPISRLSPGVRDAVCGIVVSAKAVRLRGKRLSIFEAVLRNEGDHLKVTWFNQPFLQKSIVPGAQVIVYGTVSRNTRDLPPLLIENPEFEVVEEEGAVPVHTGRVVPVYRITDGISQKQFRAIMYAVVHSWLQRIGDPLPGNVAARNGLPSLQESLQSLHFPSDASALSELNAGTSRYHRRIAFEELFIFSAGLIALKRRERRHKGIAFDPPGRLRSMLISSLPFALTAAQQRVIEEIRSDMRIDSPMQRLVQGDVGCGKTVVAIAAMLDAVESGWQAVLMAPTEILAGQHFMSVRRLVAILGVTVRLITGGSGADMASGSEGYGEDILIGTHALIQEKVRFRKLGLVVIDEQHKFGVVQRAALREKGARPDVLVMTATPIPRSLALTLYGDLDCSVIDELPPGRSPVDTKWQSSSSRDAVYGLLRREIHSGRQAYIVYPAIEESEVMGLRSAIQGKAALETRFPEFRIGLLHGRMSPSERELAMDRFKRHEDDLLVSTTVIEVGVDVPNASVMVIVHAERFGLSQLHQLRGRVGRGAERSYCILIAYDPLSEAAVRRMDALTSTNDGFRIAEEDLSIRGPGEFLGTRQAGLPDLRHADIVRDADLLAAARRDAEELISRETDLRENPFLKQRLDVFWRGKADLFKTG